ncbi:PC4-domain-containing protein [Xylariomycetidae sp. FL0641]|nr:PC4-domain-containing protein [Xylariomycetidae sp. FL0641]
MVRTKPTKRARDDEQSSEEEPARPTKTTKTKQTQSSSAGENGKDSDGNLWWGLSNNRRITISDFKGKKYVNIREYYTDASGEMKPGKKGIMLNLDQYNALLLAMPAVNSELEAQGHELPDLSAAPSTSEKKDKGDKKKTKMEKKANIEATSEEGEDEDGDE